MYTHAAVLAVGKAKKFMWVEKLAAVYNGFEMVGKT